MDRISCSIWSGLNSDERPFPCQRAYERCILWTVLVSTAPGKQGTGTLRNHCSAFYQLPSKGNVAIWEVRVENLSFSPNCSSKGISIATRRVNKTGKRNFPLYFYFGILSLFFRDIVMGNSLTSAPRKGEHSEKLLSQVWFFFPLLPHSLSYDRPSGPSTQGSNSYWTTRLYAMRIRIIFNIIIWEYNKYSMAFSTDQLFVTAYYIVIKMLL